MLGRMNVIWMYHSFLLIVLILCCGCGSRSQEDFQRDGQRIAIAITQELQKIHSRDELATAGPQLTKLFDDLVDVMMAARQYHHQHPWTEIAELPRDAEQVNVRLQSELARVCRLEGGRDALEKYQEPSLIRLDAFQKRLKAAGLSVH